MTLVADHVPQRPAEWGAGRAHGRPGDGADGPPGAFDRARGGPESVQGRYEGTAAFPACAHARSTGAAGRCAAASGAGAVRPPNGPYDAKPDHRPVVGRRERSSLVAAAGVRPGPAGVTERLPGRH
ncbi:thiamine pyrophosphate-binding protein [Streptomyces sp. JHA26]|uniref:thiamine pyrophosphate-binding protein n=1 Tax=Streptomyces sp. JHA26 TaxID=1917143 RepID=UPI00098A4152|nr:thiamine pyrophosphate-binding protein [Streptomyces sp. JHA26]